MEPCGLCGKPMKGAIYAYENLWVHFECMEREDEIRAEKVHDAEKELAHFKERERTKAKIKAEASPRWLGANE